MIFIRILPMIYEDFASIWSWTWIWIRFRFRFRFRVRCRFDFGLDFDWILVGFGLISIRFWLDFGLLRALVALIALLGPPKDFPGPPRTS